MSIYNLFTIYGNTLYSGAPQQILSVIGGFLLLLIEEKCSLFFNSFICMKDDNARRLLQNKRGKKGNALGPVSNGQTEN